jgi:hypothetical protein
MGQFTGRNEVVMYDNTDLDKVISDTALGYWKKPVSKFFNVGTGVIYEEISHQPELRKEKLLISYAKKEPRHETCLVRMGKELHTGANEMRKTGFTLTWGFFAILIIKMSAIPVLRTGLWSKCWFGRNLRHSCKNKR